MLFLQLLFEWNSLFQRFSQEKPNTPTNHTYATAIVLSCNSNRIRRQILWPTTIVAATAVFGQTPIGYEANALREMSHQAEAPHYADRPCPPAGRALVETSAPEVASKARHDVRSAGPIPQFAQE